LGARKKKVQQVRGGVVSSIRVSIGQAPAVRGKGKRGGGGGGTAKKGRKLGYAFTRVSRVVEKKKEKKSELC